MSREEGPGSGDRREGRRWRCGAGISVAMKWTYLEDTKEELSEMLKHLGEEVPPHPDVWSEIRHRQAGCQQGQ